MVFIRFSIVAAVLSLLSGVLAAPAPADLSDEEAARAIPAAPHWVIYSDKWSGSSAPPHPSAIKGYNVLNLSFLLVAGAWDNAQAWTTLTAAERASIKSQYAAAGIKLVVSAFGSTDAPTSAGLDPVALATTMGNWVKKYHLDGIDVDYEDFGAMDGGTAEAWLVSFTRQLRVILPSSSGYILTHAPVAPWFSPGIYKHGAYLTVHREVGDLIDWYNIQFYNQGNTEYTTCHNLLRASSSQWPKSSVFEIAASGVPVSKIVIGKPANTGSANSGYINPGTLSSCLSQAKGSGWDGGAMVWEYPDAGSSWITTTRSKSWPV
ncbi:glycoside hydrolase family 18 protein [Thelephora ganbajun]|uniref:Glycoside hydrolase family 18 protein n=1 Tax=Thelephora ganbajun TaxID=370292 RepID=A0ACB6ZG03_THEGA|nr:glycoside hydrolase family 18 protein [Thelephora ganbajun]